MLKARGIEAEWHPVLIAVVIVLLLAGCRQTAPSPIAAPATFDARTPAVTQSSKPVGSAIPPAIPPTLARGVDGAVESMTPITNTTNSEYYALTYWSDGLRVTGFLGRPQGDGRYPAIIYNRGGHQEYGALEGWEIVPAVEAGFVAVASQYRGNAGSEGAEGFGGADVNDVLNLNPLLKQLLYVDPDRIGMMGHSRGGMMTYLSLKQETLAGAHGIKAAVVVGGVADLFLLVEDQPLFLSMVGVGPEGDPALYESRSAVYWPELINAPLLIQHGEADEWVSVEQAKRLAQALAANGKTVSLITYPGEDHPLSDHAGGWPEALRWFQQYLGRPGEDHSFESHAEAIGEVMNWFMRAHQFTGGP